MENGQVLPAFLLCSTLLVIKMYAVAVITGQVRLRKKVGSLVESGCGGDGRRRGISTLLAFPCKKAWGLTKVAQMCMPACCGSCFKAAATAALLEAGLAFRKLPV